MFHCTTSLLFPPVFPVKSPGPADAKTMSPRNAPFFLFPAQDDAWQAPCHQKIFM